MSKDERHVVFQDRLRSAGLKVTAPRVAVLGILSDREHLDAETIFSAVFVLLPRVSLQTVYGVLAALVSAGLVRKIEPAGSAALYECRVGDNHHHMVCLTCKRVENVDCVIGASPCLTPSNFNGFIISAAEVNFWGLCSECQLVAAL